MFNSLLENVFNVRRAAATQEQADTARQVIPVLLQGFVTYLRSTDFL